MKDTKLKKVFDKCKVIHALKQRKTLLSLLSKPKVWNCIFEKYGLYHCECKDSLGNLCALYMHECSSSITSNGYNWKIRYRIVIVLIFHDFYHTTLAMVIPHALAKL